MRRPERVGSEAVAERPNSFRGGVRGPFASDICLESVDRVFYNCFIPLHTIINTDKQLCFETKMMEIKPFSLLLLLRVKSDLWDK